MDWSAQIDIYCERLSPAFWAEPINAISNLAFILAALWAARRAIRAGATDPVTMVLVAIVGCIGVGSFLFHTFATRWAALTDVLPIWIFTLMYFAVALRRFFGFGVMGAVGGIVGLIALGVAIPMGVRLVPGLADALGGSQQYAPALIGLTVVAIGLYRTSHVVWRPVALAVPTLFVSLTFRTIDGPVCANLAMGTHFMWHVLNGVMLALLLRAMIDARAIASKKGCQIF